MNASPTSVTSIDLANRWSISAQNHYGAIQSMTGHDLKLSEFFPKKTAKECDNFGTFTQKILFLDYNKTKKAKSVTSWSVTIWGYGLYKITSDRWELFEFGSSIVLAWHRREQINLEGNRNIMTPFWAAEKYLSFLLQNKLCTV